MNEENTVISSREEHCLQVLPTQVNVRIYAIHTSGPVLAGAPPQGAVGGGESRQRAGGGLCLFG